MARKKNLKNKKDTIKVVEKKRVYSLSYITINY